MSKKKPFSDRRWTDPPMAEITGHEEVTPEEEAEVDAYIERQKKKEEKDNGKR